MDRIRVLVVDDEEPISTLLNRTLAKESIEVLVASNGEEALEILKGDFNISCVVSDLVMPVMDGINLLKKMRELKIKIPFIFFSAYASDKNRMMALEYDAYEFVKKDKIANIVKVIREAIS